MFTDPRLQIKRELTVLERIKSAPNVIQLVAPVRSREGTPGFVFDLEPHDNDRYLSMTMREIKIFTKQLLLALEGVHSLGIMHRDVKPKNLRYDFERMRLVRFLIDSTGSFWTNEILSIVYRFKKPIPSGFDRLWFGRILSARRQIQRQCRHEELQGARAASRTRTL